MYQLFVVPSRIFVLSPELAIRPQDNYLTSCESNISRLTIIDLVLTFCWPKGVKHCDMNIHFNSESPPPRQIFFFCFVRTSSSIFFDAPSQKVKILSKKDFIEDYFIAL